MARPRKQRRVYSISCSKTFGPLNGIDKDKDTILLKIEEYEVIRLIFLFSAFLYF